LSRLVIAPAGLDDLDRLTDFLIEQDTFAAHATTQVLVEGLSILKLHPLIGRESEAGLRELVISRGRSGYVALYRYNVVSDTVLVLAIRHQREGGYD